MFVRPEDFRQLGHLFTSLEIESALSLDHHLLAILAPVRGLSTLRGGRGVPTLALVRARRGKPYHLLISGGLASLAVLGWQIFL